MTKIDNKRKLDEETLTELQDILQENAELLNKYNFKELYDVVITKQVDISDLTYLLMIAGIDPLKYMYEIPSNYLSYSKDLISIDIPGNIKSIGSYAFGNCIGLTSVAIGKGVTNIGDHAFYYCSGLTSITIPDSVTSIEDYAFGDCSKLTSVTIPDSVIDIRSYAFDGCSRLTSVTIGNGVEIIGWGGFAHCNGLTSVTIGNSMKNIGNNVFYGCDELKDIIYRGTVKQWKEIKKREEDFSEVKIHCIDGEV